MCAFKKSLPGGGVGESLKKCLLQKIRSDLGLPGLSPRSTTGKAEALVLDSVTLQLPLPP